MAKKIIKKIYLINVEKILIFDLDGTLINSKKSIINSFNTFKKNNIKQINEKYFKECK